METRQILSIHHMQDLIRLSSIMNPIKTFFHYHAAVATNLKTQSFRSYRITPQLLSPMISYECTPYSYSKSTTVNK